MKKSQRNKQIFSQNRNSLLNAVDEINDNVLEIGDSALDSMSNVRDEIEGNNKTLIK